MLKFTLLPIVLMGVITANVTSRIKRQMGMHYLCGSLSSATGCGNFNGCGSNCGSLPILPPTNCYTPCSNINCNQFNGQQYIGIGSNQHTPCVRLCCTASPTNFGNTWPVLGSSMVSGYNNNNDFYNPYTTNINSPIIGNVVGLPTSGYSSYYIARIPQTQGSGPVITSRRVRRAPA